MDEPLSPADVAVLHMLLADGPPAHLALLAQLPHTRVTGHCPCGCPTVYLEVDRAATPPVTGPFATTPTVATADVLDEGGEMIGQVMLFVEQGYLGWLELATWCDERPIAWPPAERLRTL